MNIMKKMKKTVKSCDFCVKRKRHCDGLGLRRCSFCVSKSQLECRYRERSSSRPGSEAARRREESQEVTRVFRVSDGAQNPPRGFETSEGRDERERSALSLKRIRWSPSPATGLVGTQENGFLDDFFGCFGIFPFANQSIIRHAIVSVMLASTLPEESQEWGQWSSGLANIHPEWNQGDNIGEMMPLHGKGEGVADIGAGDGFAVALDGSSSAPDVCTLWCAIGLGALVRGSPLEKVMEYMTLASSCLAGDPAPKGVETARAFVAMGLLHSFIGQERMSSEYLALADDMVRDLPTAEDATDLLDMARGVERARLARGMWVHTNELDDFCKDAAPLPKSTKVVSQGDFCKVLLAVDHRLTQTMLEDMTTQRNCFTGCRESSGHERAANKGVSRSTANASLADGEGADGGEVFSAIPFYGEATQHVVRAIRTDFERLSALGNLSGMFFGLGGIIFASNILLMCVEENDLAGAAAYFALKVDIYLRFPGLMRDHYRLHDAHGVMASAHAYGLSSIYEKLRAAHNGLKVWGCPLAPPLQEWRGIGEFCGHVLCQFKGDMLHRLTSRKTRCTDVNQHLDTFPNVSSIGCQESLEEILELFP